MTLFTFLTQLEITLYRFQDVPFSLSQFAVYSDTIYTLCNIISLLSQIIMISISMQSFLNCFEQYAIYS